MVTEVGAGFTAVKAGDRVVGGHFARWLDGAVSAEIFQHDVGVTPNGWLAENPRQPPNNGYKKARDLAGFINGLTGIS